MKKLSEIFNDLSLLELYNIQAELHWLAIFF